MSDQKVYKNQHECNTAGTFTKETKDLPDKNVVDNLALQFPELPEWMLNAAVLLHNKNPNYFETGELGKKPLTSKEKRKIKRQEFTVAPEWFGETPEDRLNNPQNFLTQEEARAYMEQGSPHDSESIVKPISGGATELVEKIVSNI